MIKLLDKDFVDPADSDYPFGKVRDRTPSLRGTPVNTKTHGDQHQFFEKLMDDSGVVSNGLPDNDYSGFQLFEAFRKSGIDHFTKDLLYSLMNNYIANDVVELWGCKVTIISPILASITEGAIFYNGLIYKVDANAAIVKTAPQTIVFNIDTSEPLKIYAEGATSGTGLVDYDDIFATNAQTSSTDSAAFFDNYALHLGVQLATDVTSVSCYGWSIIRRFDEISVQGEFGIVKSISTVASNFSLQILPERLKFLDEFENGDPYFIGGNGFNSSSIIGTITDTSFPTSGTIKADSSTPNLNICVFARSTNSSAACNMAFQFKYKSKYGYSRKYRV